MKLLITLLFAPLAVFSQQGIVWEPEITVADGDTFGYVRPRISLVNDLPIVMLGKGGDGEIFIAKGNGTGFNTPVGIVPPGMQTYMANWTGPDIASTGNDVVVVFKEQPISTGNIYSVRSTDGGVTFSDTIRVDNYDQGQTWMPALDMDENGNPHVTYMIFDPGGGNERIVVASSMDNGVSYLPQQVITSASPGHACDCCPPEIVVKDQYQLALFRNNDTDIRDTWGSLSTDGGVAFSSTENLDNLGWFITSCPATGPHGVIIGDSAYVASASRGEGTYRVYVSTTGLSGGLSLNSVQIMEEPTSTAGDTQNFPRISGSGDTLIVVWEEKELGNSDILYSVATDGNSQTLGAFKAKVNGNLTGFQGKPDVIFKNGFVHVVYQDLNAGHVIYRRGIVADVTGVEEITEATVDVYPNPSNQKFQVDGLDQSLISEINMVDLIGKNIPFEAKWISSSMVQMDLGSSVKPSLYFVKFTFTNGMSLTKTITIN